ncbi:DUF4087 domain-containing protein [Burkholderia gladioli]|uniref:Uncharacterized protein n=1 Tax=Burkholderia gladioli (strain BSR3) TaxID=999541 RepID=F2LB38_BURGS|nr:DUF4087 domain-containing protein [Burkholderia gladioli]AEA60107.1 hypothetical protein bgla_1g14360 [Burkholderia gladioli BSR3]
MWLFTPTEVFSVGFFILRAFFIGKVPTYTHVMNFKSLRLATALFTMAAGLTACSHHILDYRNAQIVDGKIYAVDANEPFTGKATHVPYGVVFNSQGGMDRMLSMLETGRGLGLAMTLCEVTLKDGALNGDASCTTAESNTVRLSASFDDGALSGEMKIYSTDGKIIIVSASFKHGQPDGQEEQILPATGKTIRSVRWDVGKLNGESKVWDPQTGELTTDANYSEGVLNGDYYNRTGRPGQEPFITKGTYENGKFTGTKTSPYPDDGYAYNIRTEVKYADDVVQNQDDIDRMNQFGHQVSDCVHQSAYPIAQAKGRTYLLEDEQKQLVAQCKTRASGVSNASDNDESIAAAASGEDKAASAYLDSHHDDQANSSVNTMPASSATSTPAPSSSPTSTINGYQPAQSKAEKRCGWIENDLAGRDLTLRDREGTWAISTAAGVATGFEQMPATSKGDTCGCLSVATDRASKKITQVFGGKVIANSICHADKSLN